MERGQELHDRFARNLPLSESERLELMEWYAAMDAEESRTVRIRDGSDRMSVQAQIDAALHDIEETSKRLLQVRAENRVLRQEILQMQKDFLQNRMTTA